MATETVLECPNCEKEGMVRLHSESDIFECVYCQHKVDLSKKESSNWFIPFLIALALVLTILGI